MSKAIQTISDLTVGQEYRQKVTIDETMVAQFIALTGDNATLHTDEAAAKARGFEGRLAHGLLVGSFYSTILGCHLPGPATIISKISLDMRKPVYIGDVLEYSVAVDRVSEAVNSVMLRLAATNQQNEIVSSGSAVCVFR